MIPLVRELISVILNVSNDPWKLVGVSKIIRKIYGFLLLNLLKKSVPLVIAKAGGLASYKFNFVNIYKNILQLIQIYFVGGKKKESAAVPKIKQN